MTERRRQETVDSLVRSGGAASARRASETRIDPRADTGRLEAEAERVASAVVPLRGASPERAADLDAIRPAVSTRLGHEFGRLSVHADARAASAARGLDAEAYTLGGDVYLDPAAFAVDPVRRDHVLAHELVHVAQQAEGRAPLVPQRQPRPRAAAVDEHAQRIIDLAQAADRPIAQRAVAVVRAIIDQYWSADAGKIAGITYREGEPGLVTTYTGRGAQAVGHVEVGRYFVEQTTAYDFARRVLQVRHEIEHVEQERSGMTGASRSDEREFIAFYHEATAAAPAGTGRMQHSTHVRLIDGALGYYCCLSEDLQRANRTRQEELLRLRASEVHASHRDDLGEAPTSCRRQPH